MEFEWAGETHFHIGDLATIPTRILKIKVHGLRLNTLNYNALQDYSHQLCQLMHRHQEALTRKQQAILTGTRHVPEHLVHRRQRSTHASMTLLLILHTTDINILTTGPKMV